MTRSRNVRSSTARLSVALLLCGIALPHVRADVVTYSAPEGETLSEQYRVTAGSKAVDVYTARTLDPPWAGKRWDHGGDYSFASFDTDGPVEVRITSPRSLRNVVVRPVSKGIQPKIIDDHTISLALDGPHKLSIEPEGKKGPLLLFADPRQENIPARDDPKVVFFDRGVHKPNVIRLTSGQTLYLAGGAVVKGAVEAHGDDITLRGRGILDGSDWPWVKGPRGAMVSVRGRRVAIRGITIRGSWGWTIVPKGSREVTVDGVKICNGRVQNDDGINPCNSQDVVIRNCFIRSDDDCVALKGLDFRAENANVERITVRDSTLWCDRARIVLMGHESRAAYMREVEMRNIDIVHFSMTPFLLEPGEEMRLENIRFIDVRLHGEGQRSLATLRPVVNQYMRKKVPGHIRGISFENVTVHGARSGDYRVLVAGADEKHQTVDVRFSGVTILDQPLTRDSRGVQIGAHASDLRFAAPPSQAE